jgi:hypothetical protein
LANPQNLHKGVLGVLKVRSWAYLHFFHLHQGLLREEKFLDMPI